MNKYVGSRYVPTIIGEHDKTKSYESLSIVTSQGNSYTSKTLVPIGIDITNENYWVCTGNYNAQFAQYQSDLNNYINATNESIGTLTDKVTEFKNNSIGNYINIWEYKEQVSDYGLSTEDWSLAIQSAINDAYSNNDKNSTVFFPTGTYSFTISPIIKEGIRIIGNGMGNTILKKVGNSTAIPSPFKVQTLHPATTDSYDNFDVDAVLRFQNDDGKYSHFNYVSDIQLTSTNNSDYGIYIPCSTQCGYSNLHIYKVKTCYYTCDSWKNRFDTLTLNTCESGIVKSAKYNNVGGPGDTYNNIFVEFFTKYGFQLNYSAYNVFNNCLCQDFTDATPYYFYHVDSTSINGCSIEGGVGSSIGVVGTNTYGAFLYFDNSNITINGFQNSASVRTGSTNINTSLLYLNSSKVILNGYIGYIPDMKNSYNFILQNGSILDIGSNSFYYSATISNIYNIVSNSKIIDRRIKAGDAITLYVDGVNGNDNRLLADTGDYNHRFKTLKACINSLPKNIECDITIQVITGTYNEIVSISGFKGSGSINIRGNSGYATFSGILFTNNEISTNLEIVQLGFSSGVSSSNGIVIDNSKSLLSNVPVNGFSGNAIEATNGSRVTVIGSDISGNGVALYAHNGSKIASANNTGSNNTTVLLSESCSIIGKNGTQPNGTTQELARYGGQIV